MNSQLFDQLWFKLGANRLPYEIPIHPNLVHLTLGLFITAIAFDVAGTLFPLGRPILKFLALPALRSSFFNVGWYNLLASAAITFFTVTAGFFEIMLVSNPPVDTEGKWGLEAGMAMLIHGSLGILLLAAIVAMTVWRGLQRYRWRLGAVREVQWSYLVVGIALFGILYVQGTLGARLGSEFGIHVTAANLLEQGENPNLQIK